jgi:hypothetical protein
MIENCLLIFLEGCLDELKNKYPAIPAIEVTIPHFHSSYVTIPKIQQPQANKKLVVFPKSIFFLKQNFSIKIILLEMSSETRRTYNLVCIFS